MCVSGVFLLLITGGIHIDGYMDTMDAVHSYGNREKKLEILKDSHIGAFAVIMLVTYVLAAAVHFHIFLKIKIRIYLLLWGVFFIFHEYQVHLQQLILKVQEMAECLTVLYGLCPEML